MDDQLETVTVEVTLPPDPASVREVRELVRAQLAGWSADERDDAILLASELASNAVIHARTDFSLKIRLRRRTVRVEITDSGGGDPTPRAHDPGRVGGLGLWIVGSASRRWGAERNGAATTAWFELGSSTPSGAGTAPPEEVVDS